MNWSCRQIFHFKQISIERANACMYVYIGIYIYVFICVYVYHGVCIYICIMYLCLYVCIYVCVYVFVYTCVGTYASIHKCIYVCRYKMYVCIFACIYVCCVCIHTYMCMCLYVGIYVCRYRFNSGSRWSKSGPGLAPSSLAIDFGPFFQQRNKREIGLLGNMLNCSPPAECLDPPLAQCLDRPLGIYAITNVFVCM